MSDILDDLKMMADRCDQENGDEPCSLGLLLIRAIAEIRKLRAPPVIEVQMPEPDCVTFSRTPEGLGVRVDAMRMDKAHSYGVACYQQGYAAGAAAGGEGCGMNDRELLELAAKAAGYKKYYSEYLGRKSFVTYDGQYFSEAKECLVTAEKTLDWNPLDDDGDALRLAVVLKMEIRADIYDVKAEAHSKSVLGYAVERATPDPYAATRRAIVRAAAAIGEAKQDTLPNLEGETK